MSKREHKSPLPPFSENLVFWAPLTQGDFTDHISGVTGTVQYNNSAVWNSNMGMYLFTKDNSYSPPQGIMKWGGLNMAFNDLTNVEYTYYFKIHVKTGGYNQWGNPTISPKWIGPIILGERQIVINCENYNINTDVTYKCVTSRFPSPNNRLYAYRDGINVFSYTYPSALSVNSTVRDRVYMNYCNSSGYTGCQFYLSDMRIYNRALSASEVAQL